MQKIIYCLKNFYMKKIVCFLVIVCVFSCKEVVKGNDLYFEDVQPANDPDLKMIPNKFLGLYKDEDSVFLKIDKNLITKYRFGKGRIHKAELDSLKKECYLIDQKLVDKKTKTIFEMKKIGDSIELSHKEIDTIFQFSDVQKAKRNNFDLILNFKSDDYWQVNILSLENKILKFKYLSVDDLPSIDSIMARKSKMIDSSKYVLKPSKKEFKKILRQKLDIEFLYKKQ